MYMIQKINIIYVGNILLLAVHYYLYTYTDSPIYM